MSSDTEENIEDHLAADKIGKKKNNKDPKKKKWKKIANNSNKKHKRTKSKISNALERSFNQDIDNEEAQNTSISVPYTSFNIYNSQREILIHLLCLY